MPGLTGRHPFIRYHRPQKGNLMKINTVREMKSVLTGKAGRVVGFTKSDEPGLASLAVPGARAQLDAAQLRELAEWANETAAEIERPQRTVRRFAVPPYGPFDRGDRLAAERRLINEALRGA